MSNIIMINRDYDDDMALDNVIKYCTCDNKCMAYYALGTSEYYNILSVIESMKSMRRFLDKESGKQLCHFVVTIDSPYYDWQQAIQFSMDIAVLVCNDIYELGYQVFSSIHDNTNMIHVHFIVNTLNLKTGKLMNDAIKIINEIHNRLAVYFPRLNMRGVICNSEVNYDLDEIDDEVHDKSYNYKLVPDNELNLVD